MTTRIGRRGAFIAAAALAAAAAAGAAAAALSTPASPGRSPARAFPGFSGQAAPATWLHLELADGTGVLSYPPELRPIRGDTGTVTVASRSPAGAYLLYLNATPRQGAENLRHWAAFRLRLLREDDASSARLDAAATGLTFRGGTGSCVIDDYITRIGAHHYQEIACLVQGRTSASVVVAAAPAAQWARARPLLEQAVAAYRVR